MEELTLFQWTNAPYAPFKPATVPVRNYNFPKLVQTTKVKWILFISRLYQVDQTNILCMEIKFETLTTNNFCKTSLNSAYGNSWFYDISWNKKKKNIPRTISFYKRNLFLVYILVKEIILKAFFHLVKHSVLSVEENYRSPRQVNNNTYLLYLFCIPESWLLCY